MAKWTRELILRDILRRESAGLPLTPGYEGGVESAMYQAGSRIFGSWPNALRAAGVVPHHVMGKNRWPPSRVLATIRALFQRRRTPRAAEIKRRHGSLMEAARRIYGSWSKAVIAAGFDPFKLRKTPPWTRERILEALLSRALKNEPLTTRTVQPPSLAGAAIRVFGSWNSALTAAGLDAQIYAGNAHRVIVAADGESASPKAEGTGSDEHAKSLGVRAIQASPASRGQQWSRESVLIGVRVRLGEHRAMNAAAVRDEDQGLYRAARRRFGNWRNALRAAGLNPDEFRLQGGVMSRGGPCCEVANLERVSTIP